MSLPDPEDSMVKDDLSAKFQQTDGGKRKRRSRPIVVCAHCRKRKIKCDKKLPCSNCVKINMASSCTYDTYLDRRPGDEYKMEIQLDMTDSGRAMLQAAGPSQGYVGLFVLDNGGRQAVKRPKKNVLPQETQPSMSTHPIPSSAVEEKNIRNGQQNFVPPNPAAPQVSKSEIEMLKERLKQIERSLLGSVPRAHQQYASNAPTNKTLMSTLTSVRPITSQVSSLLAPQMPAPNSPLMPPLSVSTNINSVATNGTRLSPLTQNFQCTSSGSSDNLQQMLLSMLPPLNTQFRYPSDTPLSATRPQSIPPVDSTDLADSTRHSFSSSQSIGNRNSSTDVSTVNSAVVDPPNFHFLNADEFLIGTNIYHHPGDTINFYEKYSSVHYKDPLRRINFGPFAWTSLMCRDNGLRLMWNHIVEQKGKSAALVFAQQSTEITQEATNTILTANKFADHLEKQFQKRALQADGYDELIPYNSILKARQERNIQKQNLNRTTLPLGLTFYDGQIDRELQLIEKIQVVLPKKRVVWKLIYRYFTWVYSYMPFLDEEYFRRDVARIIGPQSLEDKPIKELKIEKKLDLATVGILLIVLRLAYLSLFSNNSSLNEQILSSNDPSPEIQESKYLMQNPININTIDVAQLCLDQFQVFRRTNFTVMQLTLYLRLYHTYAPEDGDGADGGDSQVLNAILLQMAYTLGLNREPDEQCKDLKINNLSRKIWSYLLMSDLYSAHSFGNPMSTDSIYYDTKPPFHVSGGENIIDKDRDRLIHDRYSNCTFLFPALGDLVKITLDIKARVPLPLLCAKLSKIEVDWHSRCGTLKDCITCGGKGESFAVERNLKVKIYLAFKAFLISIYFHIYLYYEAKNTNVAFFYLKKCLLITTSDIMPHYSALLGKSEVISDMIINPTLEVAVHKSNMVYLSAMLRVNFVIFHLRQSGEHSRLCKEDKQYMSYFQLLCQVSSCLTRAAEYTISAISKISNRYYYAWRIVKGQTILLKNATSTQFYEENYHSAYLLYSLRMSSEQLEELIKICESTLSKFRHSEFCTYGFSKQADKQLFNCSYSPADSARSEGLSTSNSSNPTDRINNSEIDKLWLQVLSMKHDQLLAGNFQEGPVDTKAPMPQLNAGPQDSYYDLPRPSVVGSFDLNTPGGTSNDIDRFGYDIEMANKFDLFSDVPFDQIFNF